MLQTANHPSAGKLGPVVHRIDKGGQQTGLLGGEILTQTFEDESSPLLALDEGNEFPKQFGILALETGGDFAGLR